MKCFNFFFAVEKKKLGKIYKTLWMLKMFFLTKFHDTVKEFRLIMIATRIQNYRVMVTR